MASYSSAKDVRIVEDACMESGLYQNYAKSMFLSATVFLGANIVCFDTYCTLPQSWASAREP